MPDKLPINLPVATPGTKIVHAVNTDDPTDTPQGTSQQVQVADVSAVSNNAIPKKVGQEFVDSALIEDAVNLTSSKPIFAPSLNVLPGTVTIGPHALKSGGQTFTFTNTIDQEAFEPVWIDQATGIPFARKPVGVELTFPFETSKADILINPIWNVTPTFNQRTVSVTFETDTTITNVIGQVFNGGQLFYQAELGTLTANVETKIELNPTTDNVPVDVFVGPTYEFRLISADGDVRAKGSTINALPFFTLSSFAFVDNQVTVHSESDQRQIIRSGIKTNFSVLSQNADTEVAISADIGTEFDVYFNASEIIDNLDGSIVTITDQVHNVPNSPTGAKYFVHATDAGVIGSSTTKTAVTNLTQVHLFEYIAVNGVLVPESLIANPSISWSDKTLEGILSTDSIRVNDLVVGSTNNASLGLTTTNFNVTGASRNYEQSKINPHVKAVTGKDPQNWTYLIQNTTIIPTIGADLLLDPTQYDNAGALAAVGANQASVQLVIVEGDDFAVLYGQQLFSNYDDAILNMDAIEFIIPPSLFNAVEVCRIAIKGNATDSADDQEVTIRNFSSGSSGGNTDLFVTQSLIAPTFSDARFFSELGLANTQTPAWTITQSGLATVTIVSESVMGITQDVHKLSDNTSGGIATVLLPLTAQDWTDIFNLDASYGGVIRLDSTNGDNGCFWGLGCLAVDSPDASPDKRRFGLNLTKSLTTNELRVSGTDGNALDVDVAGTTFNSYNDVVLKITRGTPPTAEVFVNSALVGALTFNVHTGGTQTDCSWSSGSTGGTDRITYMSNYGVTIYTSDNNILVDDAELNVNTARSLLPPGNRDYIVTLAESITGSAIGSAFEFTGLNIGGSVTVTNENPSNPKALFNNLREITIQVDEVLTITGVNSVEGGNIYNFKL